MSLGTKALIERVRQKLVDDAQRILSALGGSLRHKVKLPQGAGGHSPPLEAAMLPFLSTTPRTLQDVVTAAEHARVPTWRACAGIASLVGAHRAAIDRVEQRTKAEELGHAR